MCYVRHKKNHWLRRKTGKQMNENIVSINEVVQTRVASTIVTDEVSVFACFYSRVLLLSHNFPM